MEYTRTDLQIRELVLEQADGALGKAIGVEGLLARTSLQVVRGL
jgi:hypothetical protein